MSDALGAVRALLQMARDVSSTDERLKLCEAASALQELEEENRRLSQENQDLRLELRRRKDLEREGAAYFLVERDGSKTGPLCPTCYTEEGLVSMLARRQDGRATCVACGREYAGVRVYLTTGRSQRIL